VALALLAGCPSTTVYRTADPVPPGQWQVGGAVAVGGLRDTEQDTRAPTAAIELSARRGIAPDVDVGAKLYTLGAQLEATWRVHRGTWSWALAPHVGGMKTNESGAVVSAINLFVGSAAIASRPLSRRWTVGMGPLAGWGLYWPETGGHAQGFWLGGFVHADARLGRRWHLTPELGVYRVVLGEVPVRGSAIHLGAAVRLDL
jgi:hypothetical protein